MCSSGGIAVDLGERLVDPHEAELAVPEADPDGRRGEQRLEQRVGLERLLVQPRPVERDRQPPRELLGERRSPPRRAGWAGATTASARRSSGRRRRAAGPSPSASPRVSSSARSLVVARGLRREARARRPGCSSGSRDRKARTTGRRRVGRDLVARPEASRAPPRARRSRARSRRRTSAAPSSSATKTLHASPIRGTTIAGMRATASW